METKPTAPAAAAPDELLRLAAHAETIEPAPLPDPNKPAEPAEPEVPTAEVLAQLYFPLAIIAAPNWKMQESECKALAEAHAVVIDKYWPGGLSQMGPELAAVMVTLAVLGPRMMSKKPLRIQEEPEAPKRAEVTTIRPVESAT